MSIKIFAAVFVTFLAAPTFAQLKQAKPTEPAKLGSAAEPVKVESATVGKLELPVPLSQAPNAKPTTGDGKKNAQSNPQPGQTTPQPMQGESVPPMQPLDGKAIDDIQARLGGGKRNVKPKPEFELIRIADVENRKSAIVERNSIRTRIYIGSTVGKFTVRDIEADGICLVDSVAAKKCTKLLTFIETE